MKNTVWFKDFDGVSNPFTFDPEPKFLKNFSAWEKTIVDGYSINYSPDVVEFVNSTNDLVEVKWLTTWKQDAVTMLSPALGFDTFPVVDSIGTKEPYGFQPRMGMTTPTEQIGMFNRAPEGRWWKLNAILDHIKNDGRDFIWTDDHIFSSAMNYVKRMAAFEGIESLIIKPHSHLGLTPDDLKIIEKFATDRK